jgi:molybdopterin biosynthesis enzyme
MAQGALEQDDSGKWYVRVQHGNGSGDMVSPTKVDGFVELTRGKELFKRGEVYDFVHFHPVFK